MAIGADHRWLSYVLAAGLMLAPAVLRAQSEGPAIVPPNLAAAAAQYRHALEEYNRAQSGLRRGRQRLLAFGHRKAPIAQLQARARRGVSLEDYVLDQPPVYTGPPKPRNPLGPEAPAHRVYVPVVADFLAAAATGIQVQPAAAAERQRVQTRLCRSRPPPD